MRLLGPIRFLFYRAARDYADYRIIAAEKRQGVLTAENADLIERLKKANAERVYWQNRFHELRVEEV